MGEQCFVIGIYGGTVAEVSSAIERLAGCSLRYALQLPHQAALQPQGWLEQRCRCYHDVGTGTLYMGLAAVPLGAEAAVLSRGDAREQEAEAQRALLLLFLTSHSVLWLQQGQQAPAPLLPRATGLLLQLRLLQQLKSALLPALPPLLGLTAAEATATLPGLCIPQLLLLVQQPAAVAVAAGGGAGAGAAVQGAGQQLAERMAAAEQQLRLLLQRCKVLLPQDNARSLCSLPPSPPASTAAAGSSAGPTLLLAIEQLGSGSQQEVIAAAFADLQAGAATIAAGQQPGKTVPAGTAVAAALAAHRAAVVGMASAGSSSAPGASSHAGAVLSWHQAVATLAPVLEAAALQASPQPAAAAGGSISSANDADAAAAAAPEVIVPAEAASAAAWQASCGDTVQQFSLASCKRAAAVAADAYRRNTPPLLPAAGHAVALQAALRLYRSLARGPAAADGASALQQQLDAYWGDGHVQCDAVSFLGNPCCLPAHDAQQAHTSGAGTTGSRHLLLASASGGQQHSIPEPFTVAELQQAAAAVASDSATAAARAQFHVRRLTTASAGVGQALAGAEGPNQAALHLDAAAAEAEIKAEAEAAAAAGAGLSASMLSGDTADADATVGMAEAAAAAAGDDAGAGQTGSTAAAIALAAAAAVGVPAAGCWLELHVLGPRTMYKSAALAAALLLDGQPGWLRGAGACQLAALPVLVSVPWKAGQEQQAPAGSQQQQEDQQALEEFPSLAELKQQELKKRQPAPKKQQQQQQQRSKGAAAAGVAAQPPQPPQLLTWPGWQPPVAAGAPGAGAEAGAAQRQPHQRAPLFMAPGGRQQQLHKGGRQRAGSGSKQQAGTAAAAGGPAAAAAAVTTAGATEQASVLLGVEYESVNGQRLLLTPALLAAALQTSLDTVSVRQQAPAAAPPAPRPGALTLSAAAAAAQTPPAGAAAFLLLQDLPLWLQLPAEQVVALAGSSKRRSLPGVVPVPPAGAGAAAGSSDRPTWLQLRRVLVGTPELAVPLEADPKLLVEVPQDMLDPPAPAGPSAGASSSGSNGSDAAGGSKGDTALLHFSLPAPLQLPPSSFCVLALPWLLTAPMGLRPATATGTEGSSGGGGRGSGGGAPTPTALIRQAGPLRAALQAGTAVRPAAQPEGPCLMQRS